MMSYHRNAFRGTGILWGGNLWIPVDSPHKEPVMRALMSYFLEWANGWINRRLAGGLRRYDAHCDVTVINKTTYECIFCGTEIVYHTSRRDELLLFGNPWTNPSEILVQVFTFFRQSAFHDDVIKCKQIPCYWPFVRGIHRSPINSPHKASDTEL